MSAAKRTLDEGLMSNSESQNGRSKRRKTAPKWSGYLSEFRVDEQDDEKSSDFTRGTPTPPVATTSTEKTRIRPTRLKINGPKAPKPSPNPELKKTSNTDAAKIDTKSDRQLRTKPRQNYSLLLTEETSDAEVDAIETAVDIDAFLALANGSTSVQTEESETHDALHEETNHHEQPGRMPQSDDQLVAEIDRVMQEHKAELQSTSRLSNTESLRQLEDLSYVSSLPVNVILLTDESRAKSELYRNLAIRSSELHSASQPPAQVTRRVKAYGVPPPPGTNLDGSLASFSKHKAIDSPLAAAPESGESDWVDPMNELHLVRTRRLA
ncbi:hypothetical protein LTR04_001703 [Oleoguttula sp. CCFEE 6159]|nr:hypothetical protein LTR04_001703 [Oleoguttula sp. CCFEE 6159]